MAPRKDSEVIEVTTESGSNVTATNTESSAESTEQNERSDSSLSLRAVLEPSEDDPLFKREVIRKPYKTYKAIMTSFTSTGIYLDSDMSNGWEGGQTLGCCMVLLFDRRTYIGLFKGYQNFAVKFRNSKLVYIVQILLLLLPFSACWMGAKYSGSCPGSPDLVPITGITGIFGFLLVCQWMAIKGCASEDRPCEGQQKSFILVFFVLVVFMLELEIYLFTKQSVSFNPKAINYCSEVFYDYTYYKFIAAFGSMLLVVLLYFPDYRSYASGVTCSDPIAGSCYQAMEDRSD